MFAHRPPAANGILNDMDEKNEMDDIEVLDSCEVSKVAELRSSECGLQPFVLSNVSAGRKSCASRRDQMQKPCVRGPTVRKGSSECGMWISECGIWNAGARASARA